MRSHAKASSAGSTEGSGNRRAGRRSLRMLGLAMVLVGALSLLFGATCANAFNRYEDGGEFGAHEFSHPGKLAVDDATGNVLVADSGPSPRIQVWGPGGSSSTRLLSFGAGLSAPYGIAVDQNSGDVYVSNGGRLETQTVTVVNADAGTYTLTFSGQTTAPIAFDADAETIEAALVALSNLDPGDVHVEGGGPLGAPFFAAISAITFTGALAHTDAAQIIANGAALHDDPEASGAAAVSTDTTQSGGIDEIVRFVPDVRANPTTYTRDPSFVSPAQGPNATAGQVGDFESPLAVDPATGDLLVADDGNKYVERFDSVGAFVGAFNGATTSGGPFQYLFDVAIGGGVTYVLDATGPYTPFPAPIMTGISRVEEFNASGAWVGSIKNTEQRLDRVRDIAYGNTSKLLFAATQGINSPPGVLHVYRDGQSYQDIDFTAGSGIDQLDGSAIVGLAVDDGSPGASGRVYGARGLGGQEAVGRVGVQVFNRLRLPDVTLDPPTNIATTSMHVSGPVDPLHGSSWGYYFKYRRDAAEWKTTPEVERSEVVTESDPPKAAEADITNLDPNTSYEVRLVGTNSDGQHESETRTASTLPSAPAVVTEEASNRSSSGAILHGSVNPLGSQSSYHFEYGPTATYGSRAPVGHESVVGNGQVPRLAVQSISGLQSATTYHYRLVAENSAGTQAGEDKTFTTLSATEVPVRSYELVSPADKGGNNVKAGYAFQASEDGDAFSYLGATALGGLSESAPYLPRYVGRRTSTDWTTKGTDPPQRAGFNTELLKTTFGVSEDGTKAVVASLKALAPGAVEGDSNIYLYNTVTGHYITMATVPGTHLFDMEAGIQPSPVLFVQGTPNFDHVLLFGNGASFLPGAPTGALYDYTDGHLQLVSVDPGGNPTIGSSIDSQAHGMNVMSTDGSRVVFGSTGGVVYMRSNGETKVMSESHRSSDPGALRPATLLGGDRDLRYVFFLSQNLTDSSIPDTLSLYRYDTKSEELQLLTQVTDHPGGVALGLQVSADGSGVYFRSQAPLTPGSSEGDNIFVWRSGSLSLVAGSTGDHEGVHFWSSPSGRYFAFRSTAKLTGYDPTSAACGDSCPQVYRYDADTDELVCVSCRPDGRAPVSSAGLGNHQADGGSRAFLRAVDDSGQVFFDTGEQLVPSDTNSFTDVYEYDDNGLRLISDGSGTGSQIADVSVDGSDVFFTTKDRLVGIDTDKATDVYDARIDGGLASQNPPPPRDECIRDDCKAVPNAGPELPFGGSEGLSGPENVREATKPRCRNGRRVRKVRGKERCVKAHRHGQKQSNGNRRQGR